MKHHLSALQTPRGSLAAALLVIVLIGGWLSAPDSHSQGPSSTTSNAALNGLILKLKSQQDEMTANQTKIEAQTALLKEDLRQAKIYAGRGGSGHR